MLNMWRCCCRQIPGKFDGLRIECRHCGVYEVNGTVLDRLLRLPLPERTGVLEKAKRLAAPGRVPQIGVSSVV
jgi:hypothetical protein